MLKVSKTSSDNSAAHLDRWASLVTTDSMSLLSPWDLKLKAQHTKMLMFDKTTIPIQFSRCWRNNSGPGQILLFLPKDDPVFGANIIPPKQYIMTTLGTHETTLLSKDRCLCYHHNRTTRSFQVSETAMPQVVRLCSSPKSIPRRCSKWKKHTCILFGSSTL